MPNIKSAEKRVAITKVRTLRNKMKKSALKTALKKADTALAAGAADQKEAVRLAVKALDKAAANGIIHKNNAANKKSKLVSKLNKASA